MAEQTTPSCDPDKNNIPTFLTQNDIDEDGNGIPDYIDAQKASFQNINSQQLFDNACFVSGAR